MQIIFKLFLMIYLIYLKNMEYFNSCFKRPEQVDI